MPLGKQLLILKQGKRWQSIECTLPWTLASHLYTTLAVVLLSLVHSISSFFHLFVVSTIISFWLVCQYLWVFESLEFHFFSNCWFFYSFDSFASFALLASFNFASFASFDSFVRFFSLVLLLSLLYCCSHT